MTLSQNKLFKGALLVLGVTTFMACSEEAKDVVEATSITLAGQFDTAGFSKPSSLMMSASVGSMAITDYKFFCVSFEAVPQAATSSIAADGSFSLQMPKEIPFGCFVNDVNNVPVATVRVIDSTNTGMSSESSDSLNLSQNVDLGSLSLDLDSGEVAIPHTRVATAKNTNSAGALNLADVHNKSYDISCLNSGNAANDRACAAFVLDSPHVFFRILKATTSAGNVRGLGVWAAKSAFDACGSIDMRSATASGIATSEGNGFAWDADGNSHATSFSNGGTSCVTRDASNPNLTDANNEPTGNIGSYYAMDQLVQNGNGYTMLHRDQYDGGNGCLYSFNASVTFTPGSGSSMIGAFSTSNTSSGASCADNTDFSESFVVQFSPAADQ